MSEHSNISVMYVLYLQESCYPYWGTASGDNVKNYYGEFIIEGRTEHKKSGYIERKICIYVATNKSASTWNTVQFQITDWRSDGVVREPRTLLQVINEVMHRQQKIRGGPVVVHCR